MVATGCFGEAGVVFTQEIGQAHGMEKTVYGGLVCQPFSAHGCSTL